MANSSLHSDFNLKKQLKLNYNEKNDGTKRTRVNW
jgi:hypothetical protein